MRVSEKDAPQFDLVTDWVFEVPPERVWAILRAVEDWPSWWPSVRKIEPVSAGNGDGSPDSDLSPDLADRAAVQPRSRHRGHGHRPDATDRGARAGRRGRDGHLDTAPEAGTTFVRYVWRVGVTRAWMRAGLLLLLPAFAWNHGKVMEAGRLGLQQRIAAAPHG